MVVSNLAFLKPSGADSLDGGALPEVIRILRKHLGMDIAFLSEFYKGNREIRLVDTKEADCPIQPGHCTPLQETYCRLIIEGKLPGLMNDVNEFPIEYPATEALPVTQALNIRSYISTPIYLADGSVYGTLCCYSHAPGSTLNKRDLSLMQACAEIAAKQIDMEHLATSKQREANARIEAILSSNKLLSVYQPICNLPADRIVGFEALFRSEIFQNMPPQEIFNEAHLIGLGPALEIKAIRLALSAFEHIDSNHYISVNASPETVLHKEFQAIFLDKPLDKITLEITEHAAVEKYQEIKSALYPLRQKGMRLAVDDAGAGFSSFRHILELCPDRIKLDRTLIKNINADASRRALAAAFVRFSQDTQIDLIAEGVETSDELKALSDLGIEKAQGNFLAYPMPLHQALRAIQTM